MQTLPIANIVIPPNRQRADMAPEAIAELADSILKVGLLHAPVVRKEGESYILVAGGRRLQALLHISSLEEQYTYAGEIVAPYHAPVTLVGELNSEASEEAELEENIRRVDLTWQEVVAARAKLHALRQRQNPAHTVADLTTEVLGPRAPIYHLERSLVLANALSDPEVAKAKSEADALKVIGRKAREVENRLLARSAASASVKYVLVLGDCVTAPIPQQDYTVLLTDPPYGMGADQFGDSGGRAEAEHAYADDEDTFQQIVLPGLDRATVLCSPAAHAYVFCDIARFPRLALHMRGLGWTVFRTPLIWVKDNGRVPIPDFGPQRRYETCLYAYRGGKKVQKIAPDVLTFPSDQNLGMSAQKPVALFADLLKRSTRPGDWVLDPFCGTGTVFHAAAAAQCFAVGVELNEATAGIARRRIEELTK